MPVEASVKKEFSEGIYVCTCTWEIDESNVDETFFTIREFIGEIDIAKFVIFDLSAVTYVNSKFIGYLADISNQLEDKEGGLYIAGADEIYDTLDIVGVVEFIKIFKDLSEARKYIYEHHADVVESSVEKNSAHLISEKSSHSGSLEDRIQSEDVSFFAENTEAEITPEDATEPEDESIPLETKEEGYEDILTPSDPMSNVWPEDSENTSNNESWEGGNFFDTLLSSSDIEEAWKQGNITPVDLGKKAAEFLSTTDSEVISTESTESAPEDESPAEPDNFLASLGLVDESEPESPKAQKSEDPSEEPEEKEEDILSQNDTPEVETSSLESWEEGVIADESGELNVLTRKQEIEQELEEIHQTILDLQAKGKELFIEKTNL